MGKAAGAKPAQEAKKVRKVMKAKGVGGPIATMALQHAAHPRKQSIMMSDDLLEETRKLAAAHPRKRPLPRSQWPPGVAPLGTPRPFWLPDNWAYGVKTTCVSPLRAFISPWGKMYYHKPVVEQLVGRQLGPGESLESCIEWGRKQLEEGADWKRPLHLSKADHDLLNRLSKAERGQLAEPWEFHFAVVSARRMGDREGLKRIVNVEAQLRAGGVAQPTWYVDTDSVAEYRKLGLNAVNGGKLCEARNKALNDAQKKGLVCVQISDDIERWVRLVSHERAHGMFEGNELAKCCKRLRVSPVAAARFLLAKMRSVPSKAGRPRLGGAYPMGNPGFALQHEEVHTEHFILGDFFVHDRSKVRFDEGLRLKEDYDFTCAHLREHGAVFRNNRLLVMAVHGSNEGGACSVRDGAGEREWEAIRFLQSKWPGVFSVNERRSTPEVVMRWRSLRR